MSRIYGTPETAVSIAYLDDKGEKREQVLTRVKRSGVPVRDVYYFAIEFEVKRLDGNIGYIRLNTLQPQLAARIPAAIKSMGDVSGLILDLRRNSGGEIEGMPELFLAEKTFLYVRKARDGETKIHSNPAADAYRGPLAVLIDELSGSASELLAASLQVVKRAVVVGGRSPGSVMESDNLPFPNGAILMYPVAQLRTPDGAVLEGRGVTPDIEARLTRDTLLKGVDEQLEAALGYLKKETLKIK
jgi:carboxyl-terminal processing protease